MVVQHNMASMFTNRQLGMVNNLQAKSTEKLNSGYKINRAGDDAAGLSISEKMRWQIRGLNRSASNIQDGISYVQVADGALEESQKMLQRMNELCVQASNDTNTDSDRAAINEEIQELKIELNHTFETTEFNSQSIWYIDPDNRTPIVGQTKNALSIVSMGATNLNDNTANKYPKDGIINFYIEGNDIVAKWKGLDGGNYQSSIAMERFMMDGVFDFSQLSDGSEGLGFSYAWDINVETTKDDLKEAFHGKSILVDTQASFDTEITPYVDGLYTGEMKLNYGKIYESYMSGGSNTLDFDKTSSSNVASAFYPTGSTSNLTDAGPSISPEWTFNFTLNGVGDIKATANNISYSGAGTYQSSNSAKIDTLKNWIADATQVDADGNTPSAKGTTTISFALKDSNNKNIGSYSLSIAINDDDTADTITSKIQNALNSQTQLTPGAMDDTVSLPNPRSIKKDVQVYDDSITLQIQAGALADQDIKLKYQSMDASKLGIRMLNTKTHDSAAYGIEQISNALQMVNEQRSLFGAYQNRFEHAYKTNTNTSENVQYSESRIRDTDFAKEMVQYSSQSIISNAASSMLTQANSNIQGILELLK